MNAPENPKAFKAYKDVFRLGARATTPGGLLWCFSCSQHLDRSRFQEAVWTALLEAGREARVLAHLGQPLRRLGQRLFDAVHQGLARLGRRALRGPRRGPGGR